MCVYEDRCLASLFKKYMTFMIYMAIILTQVIDDSCSPQWMPWSSRAFVFQIGHPSTAIHIGIADYDVGPLEHECIGRVAINLGKFHPGTLYTLTYNLYESSNLTEKGEDEGSITVRLRVEIPDEKKYLLQGWKAPEKSWVNSQQWKSHRVAKYCVDGPHDEEGKIVVFIVYPLLSLLLLWHITNKILLSNLFPCVSQSLRCASFVVILTSYSHKSGTCPTQFQMPCAL